MWFGERLHLSKVEAGKFEFFPESVNLPVLVQELCDTVHASAELKSITLSIEIAPELTNLLIDPSKLKQVF